MKRKGNKDNSENGGHSELGEWRMQRQGNSFSGRLAAKDGFTVDVMGGIEENPSEDIEKFFSANRIGKSKVSVRGMAIHMPHPNDSGMCKGSMLFSWLSVQDNNEIATGIGLVSNVTAMTNINIIASDMDASSIRDGIIVASGGLINERYTMYVNADNDWDNLVAAAKKALPKSKHANLMEVDEKIRELVSNIVEEVGAGDGVNGLLPLYPNDIIPSSELPVTITPSEVLPLRNMMGAIIEMVVRITAAVNGAEVEALNLGATSTRSSVMVMNPPGEEVIALRKAVKKMIKRGEITGFIKLAGEEETYVLLAEIGKNIVENMPERMVNSIKGVGYTGEYSLTPTGFLPVIKAADAFIITHENAFPDDQKTINNQAYTTGNMMTYDVIAVGLYVIRKFISMSMVQDKEQQSENPQPSPDSGKEDSDLLDMLEGVDLGE